MTAFFYCSDFSNYFYFPKQGGMKKILFALLLLAYEASAQQDLIGVWKASCPVQYKTRTTIKHCELCPTLLDSTKKNLTVEDFDFIVNQTTVTLTKENVSNMAIPYSWDKEKHVMAFEFGGKNYKFTTYYDDGNIVLLNDDATMVLLKRKDVEIFR